MYLAGGICTKVKVTMKALRICIFLISFFVCSGGALACQSNTPEAALEEMVTTDKLEVVLKHYSLTVQEAVEKLGPKEKEQISGKLLLRKQMEKDGVTFRKKEDGITWEVVDKKEGIVGSIKLKNTFVSGTEAFLVLEAGATKDSGDSGEGESGPKAEKVPPRSTLALVSMRLQNGEWRVTGFGPWRHENLESEDFLQGMLRELGGESAAISTLRMINNYLEKYRATYPEIGLPQNLQALAGPEGEKPSAQHAMLLDPSFMAVPLIMDGYRFEYTMLDPGIQSDHDTHYHITATPLEFGKKGARSLFTDQTNVIRATSESRDANENDEPLSSYPGGVVD